MSPESISVIEQRRIEAEIIKPIYEILCRELGEDKAKAILREAVSQSARATGHALASSDKNGGGLAGFVQLQELWSRGGALKTRVLASDAREYHYQVTYCRYAEMYQQLGLSGIGDILSCQRDAAFIEGYAPEVSLTRSSTIMEGGACCDFLYQVKD
ncbi:MAG: L-2-amino-thiazoline-4-carboxylic acid hydrolase [Planctomycetota bacterium]|jgi:hypothetical protein|nr:L-2-amino-thiazoline-4-carboxylic acid hydrolase [Planctomycetota bacterium]